VFSVLISGISLALIIGDISRGLITVGMFTFYLNIIRSFGDYFSGILNSFISINEQILHINNFRRILELPKAIPDGKTKLTSTSPPLIEFKNVSFKYPNANAYIFKNLNLTIKPGEEIALVGANGAGKSTLIKLICRFYDPVDGQILINGIDLKNIHQNSWYKFLSLLTQEFNIYPNLNLKDNIIVSRSRKKVSDIEIYEALKKAEAYDFVRSYEQGLNTPLSQRYGGEEPSWGQWQKIAIARIFYRNAPVMILDEPTASIDAISEAKIFNRLYRQNRGKTLIIVSHRFSTVRNAQRILVIDKGKIVEQGTHKELLSLNGLYAHSYNLQAKGYQEKE
jgi:ATP-binding cassette subfamily B protein